MGRRQGGRGTVDRARLPNAATSHQCAGAHLPLGAPGARLRGQGTTWPTGRPQMLMRLHVVVAPSLDVKKSVRPCLEAEVRPTLGRMVRKA